jgi:hypothetical protein
VEKFGSISDRILLPYFVFLEGFSVLPHKCGNTILKHITTASISLIIPLFINSTQIAYFYIQVLIKARRKGHSIQNGAAVMRLEQKNMGFPPHEYKLGFSEICGSNDSVPLLSHP